MMNKNAQMLNDAEMSRVIGGKFKFLPDRKPVDLTPVQPITLPPNVSPCSDPPMPTFPGIRHFKHFFDNIWRSA